MGRKKAKKKTLSTIYDRAKIVLQTLIPLLVKTIFLSSLADAKIISEPYLIKSLVSVTELGSTSEILSLFNISGPK